MERLGVIPKGWLDGDLKEEASGFVEEANEFEEANELIPRVPLPPELSSSFPLFGDSKVVVQVRLDEPTSIIARALASEESLAVDAKHVDVALSEAMKVRLHFPQQFHDLRASRDETPSAYVASLARCAAYHATGGKSKSTFFRTADDVYVVKTVNAEELDMFASIADRYFEYLGAVHGASQKPSILVNIVGAYTLVAEGAKKTHLVVLDNLFCGVKVERAFDLKGNERNRYVKNPAPKQVLLDMNFWEVNEGVPLSVRAQSMEGIRAAVDADARFLASVGVVDYSMLVGISSGGRLRIGIIDFLQLYNYKKMIESVKGRNGAGRLEPTVVDPASTRRALPSLGSTVSVAGG